MSERGLTANGRNHQSFEQSFSEIPAVELIAKFTKIALQELPSDSMVHME